MAPLCKKSPGTLSQMEQNATFFTHRDYRGPEEDTSPLPLISNAAGLLEDAEKKGIDFKMQCANSPEVHLPGTLSCFSNKCMPNMAHEHVSKVQESTDRDIGVMLRLQHLEIRKMLRGNVCGVSKEAQITYAPKMHWKKATSKGLL